MESAVTRALTALLAGLQRERSLTLQTRATTASDSALDTVSTEISRAAEHLGNGRDHDALTELTRAALRVRQSWSYASPLSEAIVVAEQDLRRRIEERFAREWTAPATPDPPPRNRPSPLPTALVTSTAAVVTVAGVTALYANGDLAVAGPYVAPVLVAAAIWLALAWFAGRVARLRARAVTRLRDLARLRTRNGRVVGTPEQIADRLAEWRDAGVDGDALITRMQAVCAGSETNVLAASLRSADDIVSLRLAGVPYFTAAPDVLDELLFDAVSDSSAADFEAAMGRIGA